MHNFISHVEVSAVAQTLDYETHLAHEGALELVKHVRLVEARSHYLQVYRVPLRAHFAVVVITL